MRNVFQKCLSIFKNIFKLDEKVRIFSVYGTAKKLLATEVLNHIWRNVI